MTYKGLHRFVVVLIMHSNLACAPASNTVADDESQKKSHRQIEANADNKNEDEAVAPLKKLHLIKGLKEISGLAVASPKSVFAHNDENAIIYEISIENGSVLRAFALGKPTLSGDYEGIAINDRHIYLITSDGILYESEIGEHKTRVTFNAYNTGVGEFCEIEGLSLGPFKQGLPSFLIVCKQPSLEALKNHVTIFKWSLADRKSLSEPWIKIACKPLLKSQKDCKDFKPSGIEWNAKNREIYILSSIGYRILHLTESGDFINTISLDKKRHPQAEGITFLPNQTIAIADEAERSGTGRITIYPSAILARN